MQQKYNQRFSDICQLGGWGACWQCLDRSLDLALGGTFDIVEMSAAAAVWAARVATAGCCPVGVCLCLQRTAYA